MNNRRILANIRVPLGTLLLILFTSIAAFAQDGKALFQANCASCHNLWKDGTGPALTGVEARWGDNRADLKLWINKWQDAVAKGIPQAVKISTWSASQMNNFAFKDAELEAILDYIKNEKPPVAAAAVAGGEAKSDNNLLYGILSGAMLVLALTLMYINRNLRKITEEQEGTNTTQDVPVWRNMTYLGMFALISLVLTGYFIGKGGMNMGRSKDYQPEQPIYYSHKVHAGLNQINCLYCHTGAQEGKQATIPSVNVCMNCHVNIKEYAGPELFTEDGKKVNGTAEIKKLHEYAGFKGLPGETWDPATANAKPIKIHNLPDHVYFNHSQHVKAGQVACQKCHGEIQEMGEVKQHSDLSMGWCINCHRETGVNFNYDTASKEFKGNQYYMQYEKFHADMKSSKKQKLTVNDIGGTECQKCHY
jgi:cytochrome c551/c552